MPTAAENLQTAIDNLTAALATESANPQPSYSINGQSVDWNGYRAAILKQIRDMHELADDLNGPFDVVVSGMT